jgi:uncharacterized protein
MTTEVNLVGMRCGAKQGGLSCTYCYQGAVREFSENRAPLVVDHAAIQKAVLRTAGKAGFNIFGGEPLLGNVEDIRKVWAFGLEKYGKNGVQTSGRPMTEEHFQMLKDYKVHVGFSIDGPGDLNRPRWAGSTAATLEATATSIGWLERCLREGIGASVICTLHRLNASAERLPQLMDWFRDLDAKGLKAARLHTLELDGPTKYLALSTDEKVEALWTAFQLEKHEARNLRFDIFEDMLKLIRAEDDQTTCVWNACDPWTTPAVQGVAADGSRSLCQRVNKDGRPFIDAPRGPLVRQFVLAATPQEDGGCKGCRFFAMCKGHCPGTAIDGDWRKRTVDCEMWFRLFERLEAAEVEAGRVPLSLAPDRATIEERLKDAWAQGHHLSLKQARQGGGPVVRRHPGHYHGDVPHGDSHGDHTDATMAREVRK